MTACPRHGEKGVKHIGLEVGWDGAVYVVHKCDGASGFQRAHRWREPAREEDVVLAKAGLQRLPGWRPNYSFGNHHQGYDDPKWKNRCVACESGKHDDCSKRLLNGASDYCCCNLAKHTQSVQAVPGDHGQPMLSNADLEAAYPQRKEAK